jgi:hypothetical protein
VHCCERHEAAYSFYYNRTKLETIVFVRIRHGSLLVVLNDQDELCTPCPSSGADRARTGRHRTAWCAWRVHQRRICFGFAADARTRFSVLSPSPFFGFRRSWVCGAHVSAGGSFGGSGGGEVFLAVLIPAYLNFLNWDNCQFPFSSWCDKIEPPASIQPTKGGI